VVLSARTKSYRRGRFFYGGPGREERSLRG
jgi:hypothetical protein